MKPMAAILALLWLLTFPVAFAAETPTEIYTVEELLAIGEDPAGSYILMNDLDLTGVEWPCPDFSGTFDGNGHALLNLELTQPALPPPLPSMATRKSMTPILWASSAACRGRK